MQQQAQQQHQQSLRLHGHNVILSASSSVIIARIANWSEGDGNELVLHVPSLEVGELLIRCMYQAQPQLQQCSQALLQLVTLAAGHPCSWSPLQLVTLADSLDAPKVAEAASQQLQLLAADPSAQLQWQTALQI
uniref:BTB domain-containing protein n=1 Tax=Tetradesmus obliquus TaxID=3088 RepID=A0A383V2T7_TETOB|eukprot:jgi/Sobl393_1/12306/SZX59865.1